jgi:uncharacterized protein
VTLWGVFATGLLAGGASCAAVQGGLLAGLIAARRKGGSAPEPRAKGRRRSGTGAAPAPALSGPEDLVPVGGFLIAKARLPHHPGSATGAPWGANPGGL